MAKRAQKPPKRREPIWIDAARARLRKPRGAPPAGAPGAGAPDTVREMPGHAQPLFARAYADGTNRSETPSHAEVVADAVLEMARADIEALGPRATDRDLELIMIMAQSAWNQPRDAAASGLGFLDPARMNEHMFQHVPGSRKMYQRMLELRTTRFGHMKTLVMTLTGGFSERRTVYINIMIPGEDDESPSA